MPTHVPMPSTADRLRIIPRHKTGPAEPPCSPEDCRARGYDSGFVSPGPRGPNAGRYAWTGVDECG